MVIFGILGIASLSLGLYMHFGGAKIMYLTPGIPVLMPEVVRNMYIPLGLTLITLAAITSDLIPDKELRGTLFIFVVMPMLVITIILGIWNPRWMRPRWLVYLDNNYGPSLTRKMFKVALENVGEWSKQVKTQKELEEWALETCFALGHKPPVPADESDEEKVRRILRELEERKAQKNEKMNDSGNSAS